MIIARLRALALALPCLALATPALAQQQDSTPSLPPAHGPMMWGGGFGGNWHHHHHHPHLLLGLLALIGAVAVFMALVRIATMGFRRHGWRHCGGSGSQATNILDERFARGEIDKTEFEEKRKLLRG